MRLFYTRSPSANSVRNAPGLFCQPSARSVPPDTPPPPPYYAHQYQNKGVRSLDRVMNIKTKDLSRMKASGWKSFVFMALYALATGGAVPLSTEFVRNAEVSFESSSVGESHF